MESDGKKRFQEAMKDPNWAAWFNSISKEQLWIEFVTEHKDFQNSYEEKIRILRSEEKKKLRDSLIALRASQIFWFIVGGFVGTATGYFI